MNPLLQHRSEMNPATICRTAGYFPTASPQAWLREVKHLRESAGLAPRLFLVPHSASDLRPAGVSPHHHGRGDFWKGSSPARGSTRRHLHPRRLCAPLRPRRSRALFLLSSSLSPPSPSTRNHRLWGGKRVSSQPASQGHRFGIRVDSGALFTSSGSPALWLSTSGARRRRDGFAR